MNALHYPWFTSDLPGTGGALRTSPEDFRVVEVPLYEPAGEGDHAYLLVEKRGISTLEARTRMARALGVQPRDMGYAGLKDRHAVTVQTFSVEHVDPADAVVRLAGVDGVRVLEAARHRNKLRLGHLRGNRFDIVVRGVGPDAPERARAILARLAASGCPNWFGEQRFGMRGDNHEVGAALVARRPGRAIELLLEGALEGDARDRFRGGDFRGAVDATPLRLHTERRLLEALASGRPAAAALRGMQKSVLRLLVSAFQSHLFNQVVEGRLAALGTLEDGDLAWLHDRGAVFGVEDAATEQPRADRFEISPSGPLPGLKSRLADGEPGAVERGLLEAAGVTLADFKVPGVGRFDGARRPLRMPVSDWDVADAPPDGGGPAALRVRFELPKGSYATAVLHEIRKPSPAAAPA